MKPAEDVRAFAEISARLNQPFAEPAAVLREVGLTAAQWGKIREAWRARLGVADAESRELGRLFGEAYSAEWERGPRELDTHSVPAQAAPESTRLPASPEVLSRAERAVIEEAPTHDAVAAPPAPVKPGLGAGTLIAKPSTSPIPILSVKDALPFNPKAPSSMAEPSGAPPERKGLPGGTADVNLAAIARRVLVFGPEHARAEPPPGTPPRAAAAPAGPPPAPSVPVSPSPPSAPSVPVSPSPPSAPSVPVSPGPPPASSVPGLTLEQYASLCAEIAVFPHNADSIFQRYGLGSQRDRPAVDRTWRERLRREPSLYREWQDLYQRYQEYWTRQARRGPSR